LVLLVSCHFHAEKAKFVWQSWHKRAPNGGGWRGR